MLIYASAHSPSDSMAQLVPCSGYSSSPVSASLLSPSLDSQVPSPSLAWPSASYWSESRSPALYQANTSPVTSCSPSSVSSSPPPQLLQAHIKAEPSASLEELLEDFAYGDLGVKSSTATTDENVLLRQCLKPTIVQPSHFGQVSLPSFFCCCGLEFSSLAPSQ